MDGHGTCWRIVRLLTLALLALAFQASAAFAHAALNGSVPQDGSMVETVPSVFSLVFSEPVSPLTLKLVRPDGSSTDLSGFELKDRTLEIAAPDDLGRGTHILTWRVVSADGHPVGGSVVFSIGEASAHAPTAANEVDWTVRIGVWLSKTALYAGLFIGIGGVFARTVLMPGVKAGVRPTAAALATGAVGAVLSLGFQGLDALGVPIGSLTDTRAWSAGYGTTFGSTVVVALAAFALAGIASALRGVSAKVLASVALVLGAGSLALSGHASAASPQWLMRPAVFLHAAAIAVWLGALIPLGLALRRYEATSVSALARFSKSIPVVVAVLIVAGVILAIVQVGRPEALFTTSYGRVFVVKLSLLVGLFALAAMNRWKLTAPTEAGDHSAARRLARSVAAETLIVILVFGAAAAWRFTPPPRALAAAAAEPATLHVHGPQAMADLTITPGRAGKVGVSVFVMAGDFEPLDAKEVTFVFSNPAAGIEPFRRRAERSDGGPWRADGVVLPLPGTWTVRIDVLITDFEIARLEGEISIKP
ncbi:CopD family protein [Mesorhizobium sp. WSM2239]|uniref:CopD family protein n=2 Tax=unclassified Mesorhizobium TaxID=325217 RepID=A0AAU8DGT0_9HYPH